MLLALGQTPNSRDYYENVFEQPFLNETQEYYREQSQKFLAQNSASVYVRKVNECLSEEHQRSERYLDKITEEKIVDVRGSLCCIKIKACLSKYSKKANQNLSNFENFVAIWDQC